MTIRLQRPEHICCVSTTEGVAMKKLLVFVFTMIGIVALFGTNPAYAGYCACGEKPPCYNPEPCWNWPAMNSASAEIESAAVQTANTLTRGAWVSGGHEDPPSSIRDAEQEAIANAQELCAPFKSERVSNWITTFMHYGAYWVLAAQFECR